MASDVIADCIQRLGGVVQLAVTGGVSVQSAYKAMARGSFRLAAPCFKIAATLETDPARQLALARRLAGLPD